VTSLNVNLIPEDLVCTRIRNVTKHVLYVPFASEWGINLQPNEEYSIFGDPRIAPGAVPTAVHLAKVLYNMVRDGSIRILSTPGLVVDTNVPDEKEKAVFSQNGDLFITDASISQEEAGLRVLPAITPTVTYDPTELEITVDWTDYISTEDSQSVHDRFKVLVVEPDGTSKTVQCSQDKKLIYSVGDAGVYSFTVTIIGLDGREEEGTAVTVTAT